jgi:hypothetical protein
LAKGWCAVNKPLKPGREILTRVLDALLDSTDCYFPYRGAPAINADQTANWSARQTVSKLLREGRAAELPDSIETGVLPVSVESVPDVDAISFDELEKLTAPSAQGGLF